jgi:hypothetical protein
MGNKRAFDNTRLLKALEEVDKDLAIEAISNKELNGRELSEILETSLRGTIVDKETGEPLKLDREVLMAGLRNRFFQISEENKNK